MLFPHPPYHSPNVSTNMNDCCSTGVAKDQPQDSIATPETIAARKRELTDLDIFQTTRDDVSAATVSAVISEVNADMPEGGEDVSYGDRDAWRTSWTVRVLLHTALYLPSAQVRDVCAT